MTLLALSDPARDQRSSRGTLVDLALLVVGSSAVLIALILWFEIGRAHV